MKILIVDDSSPARAVLKSILARMGSHDIVEAADGRLALELLEAEGYAFDLVLLDWFMPGVPGIEVARALSSHPIGRRVPLIMVTAVSDPAKVAEAFYAGATNYVVKPFAPETIRRKIGEVTRVRNLEATAAIRTDGGLAGELGTLGVEEIIQFAQLGKRSGDLYFSTGSGSGRIVIEGGEICDAEIGTLRGEEAFYEIARLERGRFELRPRARPAERRIETPTVNLLIEAMRRRDEALESPGTGADA
jgi:two-component system chemotaxis response regulator CheY